MRVLITGATGFVGRRLAARLLDDGHQVRCLVRDSMSEAAIELEELGCELAVGDLTRPHGLAEALAEIEVAYFLVHMIGASADYPAIERAAAARFARAAGKAGVARMIYLGGLGSDRGSKHLTSRHEVAEALIENGPPLTYFRAGMVIGPGSESYELLRAIVERLPALPAPEWLQNETQPIGADDVVAYLRAALDIPESAGREVQIGGPQVLSLLDLVNEMASALGRRPPRRISLPEELARPETIAAGAAMVTPGSPQIASEISLGLAEPTVILDPSGARLFNVRTHRLDEVLARAVDAEEALA